MKKGTKLIRGPPILNEVLSHMFLAAHNSPSHSCVHASRDRHAIILQLTTPQATHACVQTRLCLATFFCSLAPQRSHICSDSFKA